MNSNYEMIIDINILKSNLDSIKNKTSKNLIISLKNHGYNHGLSLINQYYDWGIKYFLTDNLEDAITLRKYNRFATIFCSERINMDYIYDAVNNDIVVRVYSLSDLKEIMDLEIKDDLKIELLISTNKVYPGFDSNKSIKEARKIIEDNHHLKLVGVSTELLDEKDDHQKQLEMYKEYISLIKNDELLTMVDEQVLAQEILDDINSVVLETLPFGLLIKKKPSFLSGFKSQSVLNSDINLKVAFKIKTHIIKVFEIQPKEYFFNLKFKTNAFIGALPLGQKHGLPSNLKELIMDNEPIEILKVENRYTYCLLLKKVKVDTIAMIDGQSILNCFNGDSRLIMLSIDNNAHYEYIK